MDSITAGAAVVGIVGAVKTQFPQVTGLYGVVLAVIIGLVFGYLGLFGLDLTSGLLVSLASSGVYRIAAKAGGN